MKKIVLSCAVLFSTIAITARPGCQKIEDPYKQRVFVQCFCDCGSSIGQCIQCGHYHEAANEQIIIAPQIPIIVSKTITPPCNPQKALTSLVKKYRQTQHNKKNDQS